MIERAAWHALIDAANEEMRQAKVGAFEAYHHVHPVGHRRCSEACQDAHRRLLDALATANALYNSSLWGNGS